VNLPKIALIDRYSFAYFQIYNLILHILSCYYNNN